MSEFKEVPRPIKGAVYRHYKNKELYMVHAVAKSSVDESEWVVYESLNEDHQVWIRPLEEFVAVVVVEEGKPVYRFDLMLTIVSEDVTADWLLEVRRVMERTHKCRSCGYRNIPAPVIPGKREVAGYHCKECGEWNLLY